MAQLVADNIPKESPFKDLDIGRGRQVLKDFMELKVKTSPEIYSFASDLVEKLMEISVSEISTFSDNEIKSLSKLLIIENAGAFMDWLRKAQ